MDIYQHANMTDKAMEWGPLPSDGSWIKIPPMHTLEAPSVWIAGQPTAITIRPYKAGDEAYRVVFKEPQEG